MTIRYDVGCKFEDPKGATIFAGGVVVAILTSEAGNNLLFALALPIDG